MDIDVILEKDRKTYPGQGQVSFKHALCDIWVVRASELGINDNPIHTRSHLGHLLKVGDSVMGYNTGEANINDPEFEKLTPEQVPDVILVRKHYDRQTRLSQRLWKIKHLAAEATDERSKHDYHEFLDDLEDHEDLRGQINIYRDSNKTAPIDLQAGNSDVPQITLEEMMEDMTLECADDEMGEDAGAEEPEPQL